MNRCWLDKEAIMLLGGGRRGPAQDFSYISVVLTPGRPPTSLSPPWFETNTKPTVSTCRPGIAAPLYIVYL